MKPFHFRSRRHNVLVFAASLGILLSLALPPSVARSAEKSEDLTTAITRVARQTIPAVVHIEVTERMQVENPLLPFETDPFFRRFFGIPKVPRKFKQEAKALGTGMIIDPRGDILTNYHVAGGATKIEVQLSDGRRFPARLVGADPKTDLAVIRIAAKELLPFVRFGDSDKVEVGEWVVAIGHPRGLDQTVTQGIISAKHRRGITNPSSYQDFLQTDAAINPGNSGGPLLNLRGEVIGVNAAIATESGGFEGIGFTIPSNMALYVARALIEHGKVERGWMGVTAQDMTPELARSLKTETSKGALIAEVVPGGPAERAGLKKDDIVVAYRGKAITDAGGLRNDVAETPIGSDASLTVIRGGKKVELVARIGSPGEEVKALSATARALLGAEVRPLTGKEAARYGLRKNQGVAISVLDPKSRLEELGFEVGDIILEVDGQTVGSVEGFVGLIGSMRHHQKITLLALDHRTGNTGTVQVVLR